MNNALIFLNAGEAAKPGSLVYSQHYENARIIKSQDNTFQTVRIISFLPTKEYLRTKSRNKSDVIHWNGFDISTYPTGIRLFKLFTFLNRKKLINRAADRIKNELASYSEITFHCRSYYSTAIALRLKALLPAVKIGVVFDTRSFLPEEFAMKGALNKYFYLDFKAWEKQLIQGANITLAVTQRGINMLSMSAPDLHLSYLPTCGFDVNDAELDVEKRFEAIWQTKSFGYIGSVGPWYDPKKIETTLDFFQQNISESSTYILNKKIKSIGAHPATYLPWNEVGGKLEQTLFTIIPGASVKGYLSELKVSMNFFSTKAAESLSLGIPVVVNKEITEVADFVSQHNCGIVFEIIDGKLVIPPSTQEQLNSKAFWLQLHKNALDAGIMFRRSNITKLLRASYEQCR